MMFKLQKNLFFILMIVFFFVSFAYSISFSNDQNSFVLLQNKDGLSLQQLPESTISPSLNNLTNIFQDFPNTNILQVDYLNLIQEIVSDSSFYDLVGFSIGMVFYGIFVYHFYQFLSKRDMFSIKLEQRLTHKKFTSTGKTTSIVPRVIAFIAMNFFIFPFVAFLWFVGYSSIMFLLVHQLPTTTIFLVSSALIIAVRISAYYNEDLSKDLAKLLPFALLGIFLFNPQFYSINDILDKLKEIPTFLIQITSFLVVAILVEVVLSILYLIKIAFFHKGKKSKKVNDSEHPI